MGREVFSSAPGLWALGSSAAVGAEHWLAPVHFLLTGDPHAELLWADINGELQNVPQLSFPKSFLFSFFFMQYEKQSKTVGEISSFLLHHRAILAPSVTYLCYTEDSLTPSSCVTC